MARIRIETRIDAPIERCFDLARDIDLHQRSMARSRERAVDGVISGLIGLDEEVAWEARHLGRWWRATSRITEFERPHRFVDEMIRGPFEHFRHEHLFSRRGDVTSMVDLVDVGLPFGLLGTIATATVAVPYLKKLLRLRNQAIKAAAESTR